MIIKMDEELLFFPRRHLQCGVLGWTDLHVVVDFLGVQTLCGVGRRSLRV